MLRSCCYRFLTFALAFFFTLTASAACTLHLLDPVTGIERQQRCGVPKHHGDFVVWQEENGAVSWPQRMTVTANTRELVLKSVPAATIAIAGVRDLTAAPSLRLVHLAPNGAQLFAREVRNLTEGQTIRVPAARYVAMFFDARGDALSISSPLQLAAQQSVTVKPDRPAKDSNVLAVLQLPATARTTSDDPGLLVQKRAPSVTFDEGSERYAIWYGLEPGRTQLELASKSLALAPIDLRLADRGVATARAEVRLLPALTASVIVDTEHVAKLPKLTLRLTAESDQRVLHEAAVEPGATVRVESLPREPLLAALRVGGWSISRRVDLSSGEDASVELKPELVEIHGAVTLGGKPARAALTFRGGRETESVQTDGNGEYALVLWKPGRYEIDVTITDSTRSTSLNELYNIDRSKRIDIDVPDTRAAVRVTDAETGKPLAGARVAVRNVWSDASGRRTTMRDLTTNASGLVDMPPLRPGSIIVYASADGFQPHTDGTQLEVSAVPPVVEIELRPTGPETAVQIALPDGRPAAGAELQAFANGRSIWSGTTGVDGSVKIANAAAGAIVIVRHRDAASSARIFALTPDTPRWTLAPAAPPLLVKAERGERPVPQAHVMLWLDGIALTGEALAFAARSAPYADGAGMWIGANLPQSPVRLLLTTKRGPRSAAADEALAASVVYPWPASNVIAPVD